MKASEAKEAGFYIYIAFNESTLVEVSTDDVRSTIAFFGDEHIANPKNLSGELLGPIDMVGLERLMRNRED